MTTTAEAPGPTFLARVASQPLPVLLGIAVGFLGCCVAGRVAARQQPIREFSRFHLGISPEAHYYPTYAQTLNIARQHVRPGKVLVIIAGDSVLHGVGQRASNVWTLHLQRLLGEDHVVLNLAVRAGVPQEFGALVADQLTAEGVPVVLVCRGNQVDWDGHMYRYFFWDAWGKGQVQPDSRRDPWLADFTTAHAKDEKSLELRRRGLVDGAAYAADLWNTVAYKYRATVWTPLKYPKFWEPYRRAVDNDPGATVPFEATHAPANDAAELAILRTIANSGHAAPLMAGEYEAVGQWYKSKFTDRLHDRMLYVFRVDGAYYRVRLRADERARLEEVYRRYGEALRRVGLSAQVIGQNYADKDYFDRSHLSEQGGRRLAEDLAPTIRAMSARLYGTRAAEPEGAKP